jgi:hypothetical protein
MAHVLLSPYLALLEGQVRNVGHLLVLRCHQIVFNHLLLKCQPILEDQRIFNSSQFFFDLYPVQADRIVRVARRQGHLFAGLAREHISPGLFLFSPVVVLQLAVDIVLQLDRLQDVPHLCKG